MSLEDQVRAKGREVPPKPTRAQMIEMTIDEDIKKMKSGINYPNNHDSHIFAYWKKYYPYVPPAYRKYVGEKQSS